MQSMLPVTFVALSPKNGLKRGEAFFKIAVDNHIIVFRPVGDLLGSRLHPALDHMFGVRTARIYAAREFFGGGRQNEDTHGVARKKRRDPCRALPIDVEEDILATCERLLNRRAGVPYRLPKTSAHSISSPASLRVFETLPGHEKIIHPLGFASPRRAGCHRNRMGEPCGRIQQTPRKRSLSRSRRGG